MDFGHGLLVSRPLEHAVEQFRLLESTHVAVAEQGHEHALMVACIGNPDPGGMKVNAPLGEETFDDATTTETA
jgi:hypothetical protein